MLKTKGEETEGLIIFVFFVIFVVFRALIVGGWVLVEWGGMKADPLCSWFYLRMGDVG